MNSKPEIGRVIELQSLKGSKYNHLRNKLFVVGGVIGDDVLLGFYDNNGSIPPVTLKASDIRWRYVHNSTLIERQFQKQVEQDVVIMTKEFTKEEHLQISLVPFIYNHMAWVYALKAVELATEYRVSILKGLSRAVKSVRKEYIYNLQKDLDLPAIHHIEVETERFMSIYANHLAVFYFTVNNAFKKKFPTYPYDDLRTYALMSRLVIREVGRHNKKMDELIVSKLGDDKSTLCNPLVKKLDFCMEAFAGDLDQFDFDEQQTELCMKILQNHIKSIEFTIE